MGCLGVHFALTEPEVDELRAISDDRERLEYLQEVIEETYFDAKREYMAQSDKAWDAIHRALTDGRLSWGSGGYPLSHTVLGGEPLYRGDDYIMVLKTPEEVREVAAALAHITQADFRERYFAIPARDYGFDLTREGFEYTWDYFRDVRDLFVRATAAGRYVLFTASQ